jgi:hypothetical protein
MIDALFIKIIIYFLFCLILFLLLAYSYHFAFVCLLAFYFYLCLNRIKIHSSQLFLECIFGTNLINLCNREKRYVPQFLDDIVKAIELKGIDTDGLYRVNGNLSDVQKLRIQINQGI